MTVSVGLVVFSRFGFLDVVGPSDVFTFANQLADRELYSLNVIAAKPGFVRAESGLRLGVDTTLRSAEPPHTLLISGGEGFAELIDEPTTMANLARLAERAKRVVSVCTGAFALAALGLLDGRSATTHWAYADELAARHPKIDVQPNALYVQAGSVTTAAGVAAGIDLAMAMVTEDHGVELARRVSRRMVLYLHRSGGQSQFSERGNGMDSTNGDPLDLLLKEIVADPRADLTNTALARRLAVSERHLARMFKDRTGTTPAQWVARVRVDRARKRLEQTQAPMTTIANEVGFGSVETMRQVFQRVLGLSPQEYRRTH